MEGAPGGSSCSTPQSEQATWRSEKLTLFLAYFIQTFFGKFLNFSEPFDIKKGTFYSCKAHYLKKT